MVKRVFLGIAACIALMVLYVGYSFVFAGGTTTKTITNKHHGAPKVKPWNGQLVRTYNSTFIRKNQNLILGSIDFAHMDTTRANVTLHFATPAVGYVRPVWLTSNTFTGVATSTKRYYPKLKIKKQGAFWMIDVNMKKIPIGSLGDTCAGSKNDTLALMISGLGRTFAVEMVPPDAPAGHCFASAPPVAKKKAKKSKRRSRR